MITGIENFDTKLQKAILGCIASLFDMSEDIEVEELEEHVIQIDDTKFYVITDEDQQRILTRHNRDKFEDYFDGLDNDQLRYVDEDEWMKDYGIETFQEWLEEETEWIVDDSDYYGSYNFYEVH
jgi:ABC-type Fe3+-citrate transport system substrate-binding protein